MSFKELQCKIIMFISSSLNKKYIVLGYLNKNIVLKYACTIWVYWL